MLDCLFGIISVDVRQAHDILSVRIELLPFLAQIFVQPVVPLNLGCGLVVVGLCVYVINNRIEFLYHFLLCM